MRKFNVLMLAFVVMILAAYVVVGAPVSGTIEEGAQETAGAAGAAGQVTTEGGNITEVNVSGEQITSRWTGFYGEVSGNVSLEDANNNVFYYWSVSDVTNATVYAANETVSSWSLSAAAAGDMPDNLQETAPDNFANTFGSTEEFKSASMTVGATPFASTWSDGSAGNLKTYALKDGDNALIFAGKAIADESSFKGGGDTVDYQILAAGYESGVTYNFYLELP